MFWFLIDAAICNAFVVEGLSSHLPSSRSRRNHLQFKLEVAKQLIGGYSGRKRYAGKKRKATPFDNAISLPNLPGHHEVKLEGQKGACICCSVHNRRNPSGRTPETVYGCDRCGVHLCEVVASIPHRKLICMNVHPLLNPYTPAKGYMLPKPPVQKLILS